MSRYETKRHTFPLMWSTRSSLCSCWSLVCITTTLACVLCRLSAMLRRETLWRLASLLTSLDGLIGDGAIMRLHEATELSALEGLRGGGESTVENLQPLCVVSNAAKTRGEGQRRVEARRQGEGEGEGGEG